MKTISSIVLLLLLIFSSPAFSETIDLNTATLEQLQSVKGIGIKTAQSIIKYRTEHGLFSSIDALTQVKGIGQKKLAKVREQFIIVQKTETKETTDKKEASPEKTTAP